jgi:hypothetical protein
MVELLKTEGGTSLTLTLTSPPYTLIFIFRLKLGLPFSLSTRYIQLVSDLIRRLNRLMLCRSTCPIIESCLNVIADGLEFIFDTKTEVRFH